MNTFSPNTGSEQRRSWTIVSFIIAFLLMAISFIYVFQQIKIFRNYQMDLDEALHASRGLDLLSAILRLSPEDLWYETVKPDWYPPAYGYFQAGWYWLVGSSTTTARLHSTAWFFLLGLVLWACSLQTFPRFHPLLYLTPTLFMLSDSQHLVHAALSMREISSITLAFGSIYFFNASQEKPGFRNHLLTAMFALLCFLTKYSFGIILLVTLVICYMLTFLRNRKKLNYSAGWKSVLLAWTPIFLLLVAWLFLLGEWQWLVSYIKVQPAGTGLWSVDNLLFHPRQILSESSGWLPLFLTLAGIFFWIKKGRFPFMLFPYASFFLIALVMLTYRTENIYRFGMILFPPLWIIGTGGLGELIALILRQRLQTAAIITALIMLLFLVIKNHASLVTQLRTAYENTNTSVDKAYQFIAETINSDSQELLEIVMLGDTDNWNGFGLHFYLQSRCLFSHPSCLIKVTDERVMTKGWPPGEVSPTQRENRINKLLSQADHLVVFSKSPTARYGWTEIARQNFLFTRHLLLPKEFQVVIFEH